MAGSGALLTILAFTSTLGMGTTSYSLPPHQRKTVDEHVPLSRPLLLPYYLGGRPEPHVGQPSGAQVTVAPHTADGEGLYGAIAGEQASFTIRLVETTGATQPGILVRNVRGSPFIYVRIANDDHVFIAEVEDNGNGTMTATYGSDFPGQYQVYIEEVDLSEEECQSRGRPIAGSPFQLTISGPSTLDVDALPVCDTEEEDIDSMFWRPGSWVSSNIASMENGVLRNGWVFQPRTCVYDTFSFEDLLMLASLEEPTWLVVLGGSVQRGVFLTLVDMVLAQGQKDDIGASAIQKCWGYADIRVGNLRLTYQDLRLYRVGSLDDATVCNNEKLESGSTHVFLTSCRMFLSKTLFKDEGPWPTVVFAPSHLKDTDASPNTAITELMNALPPKWTGKLIMVDHMMSFGFYWSTANPTMTKLHDVGLASRTVGSGDDGLTRMRHFRQKDPRATFMSAFPMYQAGLFENQNTRDGDRCYKGSVHFHYLSKATDENAYTGSKMVQSTTIEMLANIMIAKAVGTKRDLYDKVASTPDVGRRNAENRRHFEMCTDCPARLLPFHVKPVPEPTCLTLSILPGNASTGSAWDNELCPDWCMATDPVEQTHTGSGPVDVRVCEARQDEQP